MTSVHVSTESKQDHATPNVFLGAVQQAFGCDLDLDLAATEQNKKCLRFISPEMDSLKQDWKALLEAETPEHEFFRESHLAAWLNPPFRGVDPWMEKCKTESARGMRIVSLTLASLGTSWYRNHVEGRALSLVLRKRVTFLGQKDPFPKELMIALWGFGLTGFGFWDPPAWAVREERRAAPAEASEAEQDSELWPLEEARAEGTEG